MSALPMNRWPLSSKKIAAYLSGQDPKLKSVVAAYGRCGLKPNPDLFEVICRTVIYQSISTKAAHTIYQRVQMALPGKQFVPESLIRVGKTGLRKNGISPAKADYLLGLAKGGIEGRLCFEKLAALSDEDICKVLCEFKGIGPWSAQMVLMFSLGRPDVLPWLDFGLKSSVMGLYGLGEMPNRKKLEEITNCWRPFRTAGVWYMWRRLDPKT